jgi:acyl-ACP thioesterase
MKDRGPHCCSCGNPTWSFVYRDVIRSLRDEFRCIAVDYPGFGLSSAGFDESHPVWIVRRAMTDLITPIEFSDMMRLRRWFSAASTRVRVA